MIARARDHPGHDLCGGGVLDHRAEPFAGVGHHPDGLRPRPGYRRRTVSLSMVSPRRQAHRDLFAVEAERAGDIRALAAAEDDIPPPCPSGKSALTSPCPINGSRRRCRRTEGWLLE